MTATVVDRDANIESVVVLASFFGVWVVQVNTREKRPKIFAWTSRGFILESTLTHVDANFGDEIEFGGLPNSLLAFGETSRYGVLMTFVDTNVHSKPECLMTIKEVTPCQT